MASSTSSVSVISSIRIKMGILNSFQMQVLHKIPRNAIKPSLYMFSSLTNTPIRTANTFLDDYLVQTLNLSKTQVQSISSRYPRIKSLENTHSVFQYFRSLGFSEAHILSSVLSSPQILFSSVDGTLKPKIEFFQEMGLVGSDLGKFISSNPTLLTCSLDKKLISCTQILKNILVNDRDNQYLIRVMRGSSWLVATNPEWRLLSNIAFLESCGVVGYGLSTLLKYRPRIFVMKESEIRDLVSRVSDTGFSSKMFVRGLITVYSLGEETLERKLEVVRSFGFSKEESMKMFLRQPVLPMLSEKKIKLGFEFFLNKVGLDKEELIKTPWCLMLSLEKRVIPRHEVMQILKSKRLLKKDPSLISVLNISEKKFLEKFVVKFRDDAEELLHVYKGHLLDSPSSSSSCTEEEQP